VQAVTIIMKTQGAKLRGEPSTIDMADLNPNCYSTRSTSLEWQNDHFVWNASCEAAQCNKFYNKKIHGWFYSHFLFYHEI